MSAIDVKGFYTTLLERFETSKRAAYVYGDERYSYGEMFEAMTRLNGLLSTRRKKRVAVYSDKCFEAYAAIFAIVLSDNCWVPINPDLPPERAAAMAELAEIDLILTDRPLPEAMVALGIECASLPTLAREGEAVSFTDCHQDSSSFLADDLAYIMFTSGSTGTPKGVPMTHVNYINFIKTALDILPFRQGEEVFADYHDFGFDISIVYLFCAPFVEGAFAPGCTEQERLMPLSHIRSNGVTVLSSVPSLLSRIRMLKKDGVPDIPLQILFMCGEPFRLDLLDYAFRKMDAAHIYNFYGLTETGVENFHHKCTPSDVERFENQGYVPIGKPLPGNGIHFTEDDELMLSGCQLTPGYLGGVEAQRFQEIDGTRWYATGDKVVEQEGFYFCKGRLDNQVKISGYRVELMDIEAHLRLIEGIDEAVCFLVDAGGRQFIAAAYVGASEVSPVDCKATLKDKLPSYMAPAILWKLDALPLNKSGKVDRPTLKRQYETKQGAP